MKYFLKAKSKYLLMLIIVLVPLIISACSSASSVTSTVTSATTTTTPTKTATTTMPGTTTTGPAVTIDLSAKNIAFDKSTITVMAGAEVTLVFTNNDASIPHNFSLYTDSTASKAIFVGKVITGGSMTYHFTAPATPGAYFFRCDIHPTQMTGSFIVQ